MILADPIEHRLSQRDAERLAGLAARLRWSFGQPDNPAVAAALPLLAREVPEELTLFLDGFRREEPAGAFVLRGLLIDDLALGPTPETYDPAEPTEAAVTMEFTVLLLGETLGTVVGWEALQGGRLIHNVLPVPGDEDTKTGTSSASVLELHTEDVAHPARADYLLLACARNDDRIPTTYAPLAAVDLDPEVAAVLRQPRFLMEVEPEHRPALGEVIRGPVLFGHPDRPYLAYDGLYVHGDDPEAADALAVLGKGLEQATTDLVLEPGDVAGIDNFRSLHGRNPFPVYWNGRDRWLWRCHVATDLRRSAPWRATPASPIILGR